MTDAEEIERLKGLVGRYAKHLAFHANPAFGETRTEARDRVKMFDRPSPWLTHDELMELKSYAERPV